jgi:hypothetical protein
VREAPANTRQMLLGHVQVRDAGFTAHQLAGGLYGETAGTAYGGYADGTACWDSSCGSTKR